MSTLKISPEHMLKPALQQSGWGVVHSLALPERKARLVPVQQLEMHPDTRRLLSKKHPRGIYHHQARAQRIAASGADLVVSTGTASGKTLCFHLAALEVLHKKPQSRVMVLYPQKALGVEQEARWRDLIRQSGLHAPVVRLDGTVPVREREALLKDARVLIVTPDVLHAWLLSSMERKAVARFVHHLNMVIADEVHTFTGVFGSNAAFVFRRLEHLHLVLGGAGIQYVCASATIAQPQEHLQTLFGRTFQVIAPEEDGSEKHPVQVLFLKPNSGLSGGLTEISKLLRTLVDHTPLHFLCFTDSRKQAEHLSSITNRTDGEEAPADWLQGRVLPYRSGYETQDRTAIQEKLARGAARGIVSTSALELGLDIPHLDVVVLVGTPASSTSLMQRMGRVGRTKPGVVLLLDSGSALDQQVFQQPELLLSRPPVNTALYLENKFIQTIHALCLGRHGGEHDSALLHTRKPEETLLTTKVPFPEGFLTIVNQERTGMLPADLHSIKAQAGDQPNRAFPLRDVETSFKVEVRQGREMEQLGTLTHAQVMREAYPGAIYFYATRPYRVVRVNTLGKTIEVRPERHYFTHPIAFPALAYPNHEAGSLLHHETRGPLRLVESPLMIMEVIQGYTEQRGPVTQSHSYPLQGNLFYAQRSFKRNYHSTGVTLYHPILSHMAYNADQLIQALLEGFLMTVPTERQDLGVTLDHLRVPAPFAEVNTPFVVFFDKTYGSLRLTSTLLQPGILTTTLQHALHAASPELAPILQALLDSAQQTPQMEGLGAQETSGGMSVILPESLGIVPTMQCKEFKVHSIFFHPIKGLSYKGTLSGVEGTCILAHNEVTALQGLSRLGLYDPETGEIQAV